MYAQRYDVKIVMISLLLDNQPIWFWGWDILEKYVNVMATIFHLQINKLVYSME